MSFTSSALSRLQYLSSKSASMFQASYCFGLSTKVCKRLPQGIFLGPPVSVSAVAIASCLVRLSYRLVIHPVCGSTFTGEIHFPIRSMRLSVKNLWGLALTPDVQSKLRIQRRNVGLKKNANPMCFLIIGEHPNGALLFMESTTSMLGVATGNCASTSIMSERSHDSEL